MGPDRHQQLRERAGELNTGADALLAALEATCRYVLAIHERSIVAHKPEMTQLMAKRLTDLALEIEALNNQMISIKQMEDLEIKTGSEAAALVYVDEMAKGILPYTENLSKRAQTVLLPEYDVSGGESWREPAAEAIAQAEQAAQSFRRVLGQNG